MQPNDMYYLLDVTKDDLLKYGPMSRKDIEEFILTKYSEQPIKYFNENKRLKIFHPPSGISWAAHLSVVFRDDENNKTPA